MANTVILPGETFYEPREAELGRLFNGLGHTEVWEQGFEAVVDFTQEHWVKSTPQHTDEQEQNAFSALEGMGFIGEIPATPGHYNEVLVPGAVLSSMARRIGSATMLLNSGHITADQETILAGDRSLGEKDTLYIPTSWLQNPLRRPDLLRTETNAAQITLPDVVPQSLWYAGPSSNKMALAYNYVTEEGLPITVVHGEVVERRASQEARPTSRSTLEMWAANRTDHETLGGLAVQSQLKEGEPSKVLLVVDNPYAMRMARTLRDTLQKAGRAGTVDLSVSGPWSSTVELRTYLAEVARLLFRDSIIKNSSK